MKLLQDNKKLHAEEFSNASPYVIMFGPDKCGATNKVHFIFKHKNPKTGEYEEKHLKSAPAARIVKTTTLYTLIVHPDNEFEIKIDGESSKKGNLLDDFTPSVNPEKEIDDAKDTKPEDWVDEARIPDPEAKKPEDWDEDAPFEVPDEEATKPDDWLDNEPAMIPDPEAEKPEDWDDEEDGDWIPPTVPNPKCEEASGCGKWERPTKRNPDYKGKWTPEYIDNPAYKGVWAPRKIPNPNYFEDKTPAKFEPMGAVSHVPCSRRFESRRLMLCRLVSKSGPCKAISCLTTSTLATLWKTQRNSRPRLLISSTPLKSKKRPPRNQRHQSHPSRLRTLPLWKTLSHISAKRSIFSGPLPRTTPFKLSRCYLRLLAALVHSQSLLSH